MTSRHYNRQRNGRQRIIDKYTNGDGQVIDSFIVDKGHKNGAEIHSITNTGLIIIHNKDSGKLVTKLIARPQQIERYYKASDKHPPRWLLELAGWHMGLRYNNR